MTRYAVGDVQGCLQPLQCLLEEVSFNPQHDQLWLVGDLINRGPQSLQTLRFIKSLGDCTRIVLGNHDLHFLAIAHGIGSARKSDTLDEILNANDCADLVQWLQQQPLMYSDPSGDFHMTHAGIPPNWCLQQAKQYAREVESVLTSEQAHLYFENMYGNHPDCWDEHLSGMSRLRVITNYFTRMRFCTAQGQLDLDNKLTSLPADKQTHFAPWFAHPQRLTQNDQLIFGHWAALEGEADCDNVFALDTGCVWGRALTLMNIDQQQLHHCDCSHL